mmetsp:Transcript_104399/g.264946  ORF Transcript_104399/g.264946 Transcript_104399/m.264946 type:complete len:571 (-) Transcript_104399:147-1859(-)|eukprot:CAMPEP_0183436500 /NCGR_PEP_ID=MMETSP0370-20130417/69313_1 /TAXON_ID=268820 /ORGANISM="Peridinium aciculiferum, Strain PAER-2" /LENGTH=570 /DNA_ID=CAMNT_0025623959 /DNA_START=57 /DNA_END=1769 /DNA_ORIENTATION=-
MSCDKCVCDSGDLPIEDLVHDSEFVYQPMFEHAVVVDVPYKKHEAMSKGISTSNVTVGSGETRMLVHVEPWVLTRLAQYCITEIEHFLRPGHLGQLAKILDDPEASENDRFAARNLLQNAVVAAGGVLPGCQDTGTAICMGKRGQNVFTDMDDESHISRGVYEAYTKRNLRYSQVAPITMFAEKNTKTNLPCQFDIFATKGSTYEFHFMAKGGGSANKTYMYQQTKALLNPKKLEAFIKEKVQTLGTSACPPYHIALVIGGTSAEMCLKTVKLASARYYDFLPTTGNEHGRAFRDLDWEAKTLKICQDLQVGAQFGGKYFAHDCRVIRLPRHGASCPVGLGVSCSADRQILAKINAEGVFIEELEHNPARFLPVGPTAGPKDATVSVVVKIDLNQPMAMILAELTKYPIKTRVELTGPLIVARDIAHAKLNEIFEETGQFPDYVKNHPIYYAGPAKTPDGMASGSFGPTTAGRMDTYVPIFQPHGASLVTLAKGNRSKQVTDSCKAHGGFYLGSIGGAAAVLASENIKKIEVVDFEDQGMEAVWRIEVEDFPAFILVDDKGNDFFDQWQM